MSVRTTDSWQNREPDPTPAPEEQRRSWFWPAVLLTFFAWVIASCSGAAALVGLDDLRLADFQSTGAVWTPPPFPTQPAAVARTEDAETDEAEPETTTTGRFQPGVQARNVTNSRVNVRRSPGHLSKPGSDVIAQMEPGDSVEITGWPRNADGLIWWPIRFGDTEGWVAESTGSGVQILAPVQ